MTVRTLAIAIPAAMIALGVIAASASAAGLSPSAAPAVSHSEAWNVDKAKVGYEKKRRRSGWKRKSRFSGFGFRGDGFRFSGKYK